jgi:transcriptional regulator with XRE-family HTH domain
MALWLALSEQLRSVRRAKGLAQNEVAAACGINRAVYSRVGRGFARPRLESLDRILAGYGEGKDESRA